MALERLACAIISSDAFFVFPIIVNTPIWACNCQKLSESNYLSFDKSYDMIIQGNILFLGKL